MRGEAPGRDGDGRVAAVKVFVRWPDGSLYV